MCMSRSAITLLSARDAGVHVPVSHKATPPPPQFVGAVARVGVWGVEKKNNTVPVETKDY